MHCHLAAYPRSTGQMSMNMAGFKPQSSAGVLCVWFGGYRVDAHSFCSVWGIASPWVGMSLVWIRLATSSEAIFSRVVDRQSGSEESHVPVGKVEGSSGRGTGSCHLACKDAYMPGNNHRAHQSASISTLQTGRIWVGIHTSTCVCRHTGIQAHRLPASRPRPNAQQSTTPRLLCLEITGNTLGPVEQGKQAMSTVLQSLCGCKTHCSSLTASACGVCMVLIRWRRM